MSHLEDTLRAAVRELADEAPHTYGLAAAARARGHRLRRRRRIGVTAAVLALSAITVTPYAVLHRSAPAPLPVTPSLSPSPATTVTKGADWWTTPYRLPGNAVVTALSKTGVGNEDIIRKTVHDGNVLLDPETGRYVVLPSSYYTIYGAPTAGWALANDGQGGFGIVDSTNGRGIWRDVPSGGAPQWAPDASRVLFTDISGFGIMDAVTGTVTHRDVTDLNCPDDCFFTWLPGEKEVAVAQRDPAVRHDEAKRDPVKEVAIYSVATGKRTRTIPVRGVPTGPDAWSPDGRLLLVSDVDDRQAKHVVEAATGKVVATIPDGSPYFLADGRILAITDEQAVLYDDRGRALEVQALPKDFRDRQISVALTR